MISRPCLDNCLARSPAAIVAGGSTLSSLGAWRLAIFAPPSNKNHRAYNRRNSTIRPSSRVPAAVMAWLSGLTGLRPLPKLRRVRSRKPRFATAIWLAEQAVTTTTNENLAERGDPLFLSQEVGDWDREGPVSGGRCSMDSAWPLKGGRRSMKLQRFGEVPQSPLTPDCP